MNADRVTIADVGLSCSTCFYWIERGSVCRRNPPRVYADNVDGQAASGFATSDPHDVCGEWASDQQPPERLGLAEVESI